MTATTTFIADLTARCPPGSVRMHGDCLRPRKLNNAGARMNGSDDKPKVNGSAEPAPSVRHSSKIRAGDWYTPSKQSFEEAAAANVGPGRNLHRLRVLQTAVFDPRLGICPLPVKLLAAVLDHANRDTGTAYPGSKALAEEIHQDLQKLRPEERADALDKAANVIMNMFTLLKQCGYDVSTRRAPPRGGRAVAHHALTYPDREEMLAAVAAHERWQEQENARRAEAKKKVASPHVAHEVSSPHVAHEVTDLTQNMRLEGADLTCTGLLTSRVPAQNDPPHSVTEPTDINLGADAHGASVGLPLEPPLNPKVEVRTKSKRAPAPSAVVLTALDAYNAAAERHGFPRWEAVTPVRARRAEQRIADIGGVEAFKAALTAIPLNDFLMGRVAGKNGGKPFKLDIDFLLSTGSGMGDVLAKLLDAASNGIASQVGRDEAAEMEAIYERMRAEEEAERRARR
jgi:hypothetical protein